MENLKFHSFPVQWILPSLIIMLFIMLITSPLLSSSENSIDPTVKLPLPGKNKNNINLSTDNFQSDSHYSSIPFNSFPHNTNQCTFVYDEIETGFISSPNFPHQFPIPIHCSWIIRAPIGNVITLYWTQFYLKEGLKATEYAFYINSSLNAGSTSLLPSFIEGDPMPLVTSKPVLVLEMDITDDRNIYLRNMDWFLDAFGFNITFTIVSFTVAHKIIPDYCSVYKCSFNGQCFASKDAKVQYCSCFPGFFGRYCQYGPKCDPSKGINPCKDGTDCRYFAGSHFTKCSTVDGFLGEDRSRVTPTNGNKTGFQILKLAIEDDVTPTEDAKLTLSCLIQSTNSIEVKWYKDFTLIDTETSFLRKMSTTLVRSNLPGRYVASLTMDKLYPLDSGIFTCEAFDWHSRVNSSYELKVFTKPQVKVYPLSATVYSAQPYTVSCFSLDYDPLIGYNWLKNGEILNPLYDDELIEDLYPAGIRLIVPKALTRAVYTCLVTTPLGTVGKESMLTVIPSNISSEFIQTCPKETHEDIDWPETAIDGIAVEPCPPGYKDGGVARRKCFTSGKWDEADFSSCLNYQMFYIQEKLMSLTLGYHLVSHSSLMNQLKDSLNGLRLRPSQGHFIIHLLESLMAVLKLTMDSMETHESSQLALDIISSLLNKPESINSLTGLANLHRLLMEYSLLASKVKKGQLNHQITRSNFVVEILNLDHRVNLFMPSTLNLPTLTTSTASAFSSSLSSSTSSLYNNKVTQSSSPSSTATIPSWLTDSVQVDIASLPGYHGKESTVEHENDSLKSVLTVFYQNLTSFWPKNIVIHKDFTDEEYQINSKVVTVALVHQAHYIPLKPYPLRVTAHLRHHSSLESDVDTKKVTCGLAQFNERLGFQTKHCSTSKTSSDSQSTICVCDITGAYSVLLTSQYKHQPHPYPTEKQLNIQSNASHQVPTDYLLIASFSFSIGLIILTMTILIIRSRFKMNCIKCLKLQICLATIGLECSFLASYHFLQIPIPSVYIFQSILFFQLACNCLQISLCNNVLTCVTHLNYGKHSLPHFKITFLGWIIPLSLTGAAVIANELDKSVSVDKMIEIESRYFYLTNASAFFITMVHLILTIILKIKFSDRHRKELLENFRRLDNGSKILNQSLIIIFWTDFLLTANFYYRNSRKILSKYTLSAISCLLGLNVILFYGFFAALDDSLVLMPGQVESKEKDSTGNSSNKQPDNVYAMNEIDICPAFQRVTLTEYDVHFEPGIGDL